MQAKVLAGAAVSASLHTLPDPEEDDIMPYDAVSHNCSFSQLSGLALPVQDQGSASFTVMLYGMLNMHAAKPDDPSRLSRQ